MTINNLNQNEDIQKKELVITDENRKQIESQEEITSNFKSGNSSIFHILNIDEVGLSWEIIGDMNKQFEKVKKRNQGSEYPDTLEKVLENASDDILPEEKRLEKAENILGRKLNEDQKKAIITAHKHRSGEYIPFSSTKKNLEILKEKREILMNWGFGHDKDAKQEIQKLFDNCICLGIVPTLLLRISALGITGILSTFEFAKNRIESLLENPKYENNKSEIRKFLGMFRETYFGGFIEEGAYFEKKNNKYDHPLDELVGRGIIHQFKKIPIIGKGAEHVDTDILSQKTIKITIDRYSFFVNKNEDKLNIIKDFVKDLGYAIYLNVPLLTFSK